MSEYVKKRYESAGTVQIKGSEVPYTAVSEDFPVYGSDGTADATMFTISYVRSDLDHYDGRPVLFAWNGGPGCSSVYVHMGLLSPMRVKCGNGPDMRFEAPFELINNDNCLLDTCDLVVIDAVATGYARLLNPEAKAEITSTKRDAETFVNCIRQWMTAHDRWNSPLYIMGESYGTIRNAIVAGTMFYGDFFESAGGPLHLSGVIMVGSALNYGQAQFPIPNDVLNLPSIAAAAWYWADEKPGTLREFVSGCNRFCYEEYLQALALGKSLPDSQKKAVAEKLSKYTGYDVDYLMENDLRFEVFDYPVKGMRKQNRSIGIYDARFSLPHQKNESHYDLFSDDPSNALLMPALCGSFCGIWKKQLNIAEEGEYVGIWNSAEAGWDFSTPLTPMEYLEKALHRNPNMKLMFCMGYYDMLTTVGWVNYLLNHYDFPEDRLWLNYYEGGHMPYVNEREAMHMEEDIRKFIISERAGEHDHERI